LFWCYFKIIYFFTNKFWLMFILCFLCNISNQNNQKLVHGILKIKNFFFLTKVPNCMRFENSP
jgi:hypothetical protein